MSDTSNQTTVNLIRAIIDTLEGDVQDWSTWQSFSIIVGSYEGVLNSTGGYLYSPDGQITAVSANSLKVLPFINEYVSEYYKPGEKLPVSLLIQFDRTSGRYAIIFEDTDAMRWKITPRNFKELREALRPNLSNPKEPA